MKIVVEKYNPNWVSIFQKESEAIGSILREFNPIIEHIGSTSVPNLSAKPILDIMVGITDIKHLEDVVQQMMEQGYIYYEAFNLIMPKRRFFVGLKEGSRIGNLKSIYKAEDTIPHDDIQSSKLVHVHVWEYNSDEWIRHKAFKEYLIVHPQIAKEYGELKLELSTSDWKDGNEYNEAKNNFIKREEGKALEWDTGKSIGMEIRLATTSDIAELKELFTETVTKINLKDYSKEQIEDWTSCGDDEKRWHELYQKNQIFICEIDGQMAGYSSIDSEGYIHMMFTSKEHQRKGVGKAMMLHLFQCAKKNGVKELCSNVSIT